MKLNFILTTPTELTNFKIRKYQNEPRFNGVYSRNNLPKINDGAFVINLDEYELIGGTYWIVSQVIGDNINILQ